MQLFTNPFKPGAGQAPPYLAGREDEKLKFEKLLLEPPGLNNLIISGLRGVGKTVLLETLKPIAIKQGWLWAGNDFSESAGVTEKTLSTRIITDLAPLVSSFIIGKKEFVGLGFKPEIKTLEQKLDYRTLIEIYKQEPGLETDKLKKVLLIINSVLKNHVKGIILAYDEAQILKDKSVDKQYPLSVLLEVVQYLQKLQIPYMLILTGLPTLFPNLVEARTYAERMFNRITLEKLTDEESRKAILEPIKAKNCPVSFTEVGILELLEYSSGYPYFIQFFCKESFDIILQQVKAGVVNLTLSIKDIVRKLDTDFYASRWNRVTDRQRDLLIVISKLPNANTEFTNKEIANKSIELNALFKTTQINNLLVKLIEAGLIFKNRRSKYSFAVPLMADFIKRQEYFD